MFKNLFRPSLSEPAKWCVDLVNRTRVEANAGNSISKHLPVIYAKDHEFIGALLGVIDFANQRLGGSMPLRKVTEEVVVSLFGDGAELALDTINQGAVSDVILDSLEKAQEHLIWAAAQPIGKNAEAFMFLSKYF